ncbi:hypothetical protein [Faecalicatena contorta]|uniref:Uncharacterized protein n=1 Tax=Faecalicatena contorta TaxID=39482 RepID=A0A315ZSC8_9FIRM|nr:hypothetical protein [Faecalicatena contorta]PWJ47788.1 hypothetical protein A8805_11643 [Faecalicatena contorta]SUQ15782.1 hypothetical protein SAMN05216529_11643 [Faecalicatena contorta]
MSSDKRGTVTQCGNILFAENALVENVFTPMGETSHLLISYNVIGSNTMTFIELLRLNINSNTVLLDSFGSSICICEIQKGMLIDAIFSPVMTRSIPPQSNAFLIVLQTDSRFRLNSVAHQIVMVDIDNNLLYTKDPDNLDSEIIFTISDRTSIRDTTGFPISIQSLTPGQTVKIIHANFQTTSIPPQTAAFYIQLL